MLSPSATPLLVFGNLYADKLTKITKKQHDVNLNHRAAVFISVLPPRQFLVEVPPIRRKKRRARH